MAIVILSIKPTLERSFVEVLALFDMDLLNVLYVLVVVKQEQPIMLWILYD